MATDAGERVEAAEGYCISAAGRDTAVERWGVDVRSSWSISGKIMVEGDGSARSLLPSCL
jgi:hypothetical protein